MGQNANLELKTSTAMARIDSACKKVQEAFRSKAEEILQVPNVSEYKALI